MRTPSFVLNFRLAVRRPSGRVRRNLSLPHPLCVVSCRLATVNEKRFVVFLKDGTMQPIIASFGDEDEEAQGYVFFVDSKGEIAGLFHKDAVQSWREDAVAG